MSRSIFARVRGRALGRSALVGVGGQGVVAVGGDAVMLLAGFFHRIDVYDRSVQLGIVVQ
jgi:hypothetical protein